MLSRDACGGLAVLSASLLLFWLTLGLGDNPLVPIGPGFYPRVVLGMTAALSAALVVLDIVSAKQSGTARATPARYGAVALHFAVFALYVAALPGFGFRIATFAYVASANALMDPPRGLRGWGRVALLGFATALATWLIFERELLVLLPRGRWTAY